MYKATFSDGSYENMRDAVFAACRLFRKLACEVAEELSYTYPLQDDANMPQYLKHVRLLPADAKKDFAAASAGFIFRRRSGLCRDPAFCWHRTGLWIQTARISFFRLCF